MKHNILYGKKQISIDLPDSAVVVRPVEAASIADLSAKLRQALQSPIGSPSLSDLIKKKKPSSVCVVVNDITRPVPYPRFLPELLSEIESAGVERQAVTLLVATGMHRPSTAAEKVEMYGPEIASRYRIVDHCSEDFSCMVKVGRRTSSGTEAHINRVYADADFRILTGLIEPHFMAGFSGGRKSVCPGIVDLATISNFHGFRFLSSPNASSGVLEGNPCHGEALDIARLVPPDFIVNVVIDRRREIVGLFCGDMEKAHAEGAAFARSLSEFPAAADADLVVTSGGGYPLDKTFYQTVKGMVAAVDFLKKNAVVVIASECGEGVGSGEYRNILAEYSGDWKKFLEDIGSTPVVRKDQWELQMQTRLLEKTDRENIVLCTEGISPSEQERMQVVPCERYAGPGGSIGEKINRTIGFFLEKIKEPKVVVLPEGAYAYGRKK